MKENWKKNIAIFISSQALSLFGSSLVQYAIIWHITLQTKSGIFATASIICSFLPMLFLSPFAGVWADRYNRKKLVIFADAGIALCTLVLALLFMSGHDNLWMLFAASAIRALGSAIQTPAISAMLPDIVPEEQLTRINGLNGSVQSLITLLSPMLSGALLSFSSIESVFFIDVITASAAIAILLLFLRMPVQRHLQENQGGDYFAQLKEGFRYIGRHAYLYKFFIFCALFYVLVAPVAFLSPLQVARSFGDEVWRLSAIEIAFSVGMTVGGLGMAAWGGFKNKVHTMSLGFITMGFMTFALGAGLPFWLYLGLMGVCGLSMPIFNTPAMVLLQERVEPNILGRVFGVMTMLSSSLMPLAMLAYGPLADIIAIEWMLLVTGVLITITALFMLKNKPLLTAGMKKEAILE